MSDDTDTDTDTDTSAPPRRAPRTATSATAVTTVQRQRGIHRQRRLGGRGGPVGGEEEGDRGRARGAARPGQPTGQRRGRQQRARTSTSRPASTATTRPTTTSAPSTTRTPRTARWRPDGHASHSQTSRAATRAPTAAVVRTRSTTSSRRTRLSCLPDPSRPCSGAARAAVTSRATAERATGGHDRGARIVQRGAAARHDDRQVDDTDHGRDPPSVGGVHAGPQLGRRRGQGRVDQGRDGHLERRVRGGGGHQGGRPRLGRQLSASVVASSVEPVMRARATTTGWSVVMSTSRLRSS